MLETAPERKAVEISPETYWLALGALTLISVEYKRLDGYVQNCAELVARGTGRSLPDCKEWVSEAVYGCEAGAPALELLKRVMEGLHLTAAEPWEEKLRPAYRKTVMEGIDGGKS